MMKEKTYTKEDVDAAKELQALHTTIVDMGVDLNRGFDSITQRLDTLNGNVQANSVSIIRIDRDTANHYETHKNFEQDIRGKVSAWAVIASILGAVVAGIATLVIWAKKVAGG